MGQQGIPLDQQEEGGVSPQPSIEEIIERLEILWRKLDDEGSYVRANTVALAIEAIERLKKGRGAP